MKKLMLFLILFGSVNMQSNACLNTFHALDKEGHFHDLGHQGFVGFNMNFNPKLMNSKLSKLEAEIRDTKSPYLLSDYAVLLLKAGKTQESLDLLISLNHSLPNEYKIAANLGTAYEIAGNLDSALHYIKRGVELNPNAHDGSEWVHIRVLETKLALKDQPTILADRTVLQLTEAEEKDTAIRRQLEIQVRERFPFSPEGEDPIMASLLIDLGDCYMQTGTYEYAHAFYKIAQEYYGAPEAEVEDKIKEAIALRNRYKNVKVPDIHSEGIENKVEGVRYRSILDDNNSQSFKIDWTKINLDVAALLAMVDMEMELSEEPAMNQEEDPILENDQEDEAPKANKESKSSSATLWGSLFGIAVLVIGLAIFFWSARKRKQSQIQ